MAAKDAASWGFLHEENFMFPRERAAPAHTSRLFLQGTRCRQHRCNDAGHVAQRPASALGVNAGKHL
ncbi:hypothetical protein D1Y84_17115 [Acidipila sp. EB88]|nr:hypothetical protein D1Y84_17115 [Acidipila sp. EB88]